MTFMKYVSAAVIAGMLVFGAVAMSQETHQHGSAAKATSVQSDSTAKAAVVYTCPMHPKVVSDKPGKCPKCGMKLVKATAEETSGDAKAPASTNGHQMHAKAKQGGGASMGGCCSDDMGQMDHASAGSDSTSASAQE